MFTGIISEISETKSSARAIEILNLELNRPEHWDNIEPGESISVNGVCLTVTEIDRVSIKFQLMPETLNKTSFGDNIPPRVNLERAIGAGERFGGHFVQGHVDTIGTVDSVENTDEGHRVKINFPNSYQDLVIAKGSICVDGVSLTIADFGNGWLEVALIPFTLEHTTLGNLKPKTKVNLEFDMIGKYIINFERNRSHNAKS